MKPTDICCYTVLLITLSASFIQADEHKKGLTQKNAIKRVTKRDAAIFIDSFPFEPIYKHRPQVIYRRISSPRHTHSKPMYGPPRTKYRSTKPSRAPPKKHKKGNHPKYGTPKYKKRPPKPTYGPPKSIHKPVYGPPKSPHKKPVYGPPKKEPHHTYYSQEPAGFGEPPPDYIVDYQSPKTAYEEPPTDSYGAPLKIASSDIYPPLKGYFDKQSPNFENQEDYSFGQEYKSWQKYQNYDNLDNKLAYSKKRPTYIKPESEEVFDSISPKKRPTYIKTQSEEIFDNISPKKRPTYTKQEPEEVFDAISAPDEDFNLNSYSDIYREPERDHDFNTYDRRRKPYYFGDGSKKFKKQRNVARVTPQPDDDYDDDQVIVGGQYAEPPGRYIPKFQPSAPMYSGDEDFTPKGFSDTDVATSATMSPYVNYKNSNIAFSPQNLNDAFSIVDK